MIIDFLNQLVYYKLYIFAMSVDAGETLGASLNIVSRILVLSPLEAGLRLVEKFVWLAFVLIHVMSVTAGFLKNISQ
jgi:hypothetical protein